MENAISREAVEFVETNLRVNIINPSAVAEVFNGKHLIVGGKKSIDMTRLDYLAIGSSQEVREIMIDSIIRNNLSCTSSQKIMKTSQNIELERSLANLHGMNSSLVFTSGYSANVNVMEALGLRMNTSYLSKICRRAGMGRETRSIPTLFFMDGDSHFSLQHGANLAQAQSNLPRVYHFPSMRYDKLEHLLEKSFAKYGNKAARIIVSDTLASSTGVRFDVDKLCEIANKYDCLLYLDEAHAVGAMGSEGSGIARDCAGYSESKERIILMGTLTKTFSQLGGYVSVTDENLAQYLEFACPQYIFSAPIPPWMAEALRGILDLTMGGWGDERRVLLENVSAYMRKRIEDEGFDIMGSSTHIIPVLIGDDDVATKMKYFFEENGYVISCFRFPAVSKALLRFSVCSDVLFEDVDEIVYLLKIAREKFWR